jgi:hypothetical protein
MREMYGPQGQALNFGERDKKKQGWADRLGRLFLRFTS